MPRPRSWTDDDLRSAVAAADSYAAVLRHLGLKGGGGTHVAVRVRIAALGIDDAHLGTEERRRRTDQRRRRAAADAELQDRRSWSDDDLRDAVATARSLNGVFAALGLVVGGSQWDAMKRHIERLELDVSHWDRGLVRPGSGRPKTWTDGQLRQAVANNRSIAGVLRDLGLHGGGSHANVTRRIGELDLPTGHLRGQGWSRGRRVSTRRRKPLAEILVAGSTYQSHLLKLRLVEEGVKEHRCEWCGIVEWNGAPAPLELDHVNGDRRDHRLENLRLLCPNCHAQTPTYRARNVGRYPSPGVSPQ